MEDFEKKKKNFFFFVIKQFARIANWLNFDTDHSQKRIFFSFFKSPFFFRFVSLKIIIVKISSVNLNMNNN